jgi:hypothetical protein
MDQTGLRPRFGHQVVPPVANGHAHDPFRSGLARQQDTAPPTFGQFLNGLQARRNERC